MKTSIGNYLRSSVRNRLKRNEKPCNRRAYGVQQLQDNLRQEGDEAKESTGFRGKGFLVAEFIGPKKCTLVVVWWVILSQKV